MKLGQKIKFTSEYRRVRRFVEHRRTKEWQVNKLKEAECGILVGIRTLSNGVTDYDSDSGYMYTPKHHFRALLVSTSLRHSPKLVPMEEIEPIHA